MTFCGLCSSLAAGLLYCGSGIFLSNAGHIMIIISAAWTPYVFYFTRRYLQERLLVFAMAAGACAGMIFLGGYPEMFYNLFLFLIPYTLYFCFQKKGRFARNLLSSVKHYLLVCIFTVASCAVTLIPFLANAGLFTRSNDLKMEAETEPLAAIVSMLFPRTSLFIKGPEQSMINFYVGILVVLLLPFVLKRKYSCNKCYLLLALAAFILSWGSNFFLHPLLYRFFPLYDDFRFPATSRALFAMFLILSVVPLIHAVTRADPDRKIISWARALFAVVLSGGAAAALISYIVLNDTGRDLNACRSFAEAALKTAVLLLVWLFALGMICERRIRRRAASAAVVAVTCVELLTFSNAEMPRTIALYQPTQPLFDLEARNHIEEEFTKNKERDRTVNFAGRTRSTSGSDSNSIVLHKTFDEEGYLSVKMQNIEDFLQTCHRSIIEQNPVAYFTNDVVTEQDVPYETWVNSCSVRPEQIFVRGAEHTDAKPVQTFHPEVVNAADLEIAREGDQITLTGSLGTTDTATGRIRLYLRQDTLPEELQLTMEFTDTDGNIQTCDGTFRIMKNREGNYAEIFFPAVKKDYSSVTIRTGGAAVSSAQLVVTERMRQDAFVDVQDFGFNSIRMTADAPAEGYLTLLQARHKGWQAYVDGEKTDIALVDQCFMGIRLDAGRHEIVLEFRPTDFFVGAGITIAYFGAFLAVILYSAVKRRRLAGLAASKEHEDKKEE